MFLSRNSKIIIFALICALIFIGAVLWEPSLRNIVKTTMRKTGLTPVLKELLYNAGLLERNKPPLCNPNIPPDRASARRKIVTALHNAINLNDYRQIAFLNSLLAQEAFQRAYRTLKAWERVRDPETGLVPKSLSPKMAYWSVKDAAADLFPFLMMASKYLDKNNELLWQKMLVKEREISGPMPRNISFKPTRLVADDLASVIFGASEYAKDGLLAVSERFGRGPCFMRLAEVMQSLIKVAPVKTKVGLICSSSSEVNGEMLQVLSRLYWATEKKEYLEFAERIAEAYLFDVFPNNKYLPTDNWDFEKNQPINTYFRLRDHGSEIISGLTELYLLEKVKGRPQALRFREPLKKFLDIILKIGRNEEGLFYNLVDTKTQKPIGKEVVDTWGYILNAYHTFDIVEGTHIYTEAIKRTMLAAAAKKSYTWEEHYQDGYADAIESMLYLLPWFDIQECHYWVDDEIEVMFNKQLPSGFVEKWYLDGNFIRTTLLYAIYKTSGITVYPWRKDLCVGTAFNRSKKELVVYFSVDGNWKGVLKFDVPRHRTVWNLPFEYPRLNSTPEWFVVEPQKSYIVVNLNTGETFSYSGKSLSQGLPITFNEKNSPLLLNVLEK